MGTMHYIFSPDTLILQDKQEISGISKALRIGLQFIATFRRYIWYIDTFRQFLYLQQFVLQITARILRDS